MIITPRLNSIDEMIRSHLTPDVPAELLRYTCGTESMDEFLRSGAEVFTMLDLATRRYAGRGLSEFEHILDFGCGNGRLLRFFDPAHADLNGCDISDELISFVEQHFPAILAHRNDLMPPLKYRASQFDLIYCFSVFSHLSQSVENIWLRELERVGAPGCTYLLSVHGDWVIEATLGEQADAAREAGFSWRKVHQRQGRSIDFPTYYEASYHTSGYIRREWTKYFDIVDVIKGDDPQRYAPGERDPAIRDLVKQIRPMGQDLVVARKRH